MFNISNLAVPTVDGVLKSFIYLTDKLEDVIQHHSNNKNVKETKIDDLSIEVTNHDNEIARAQAIVTKLKAFLN